MLEYRWVAVALPLSGFLLLALFGGFFQTRVTAFIGIGAIVGSAVAALAFSLRFFSAPPAHHASAQTLWTWFSAGTFTSGVSLRLDPLSLVMMLVVTVVGSLVLVYSSEFMNGDEGYSRFFAYMNLFVAAMLTVVLADDLFLLYLGWEGVGLCSYLLIGFWYKDPSHVRAGQKAFFMTRIGDAALLLGIFFVVSAAGSSRIDEALGFLTSHWRQGSAPAAAAAALLLAGAVGKSAQLPLQTWLPDAMAGPTPVSALIHAATMVTAGVYLIARMYSLFLLSPAICTVMAVIGTATLVYGGLAALGSFDIKRILAYSTMGQIGYMFLALGVGAWTAAIFHLVTHAFFKSLLFCAAGSVIRMLGREHDIRSMGGLARKIPLTFTAFVIGACSLSGLPFVTAGFYSKDMIMAGVWSFGGGGRLLWGFAAAGAVLTSLYVFRALFRVFFGPPASASGVSAGLAMGIAMAGLSTGALLAGAVQIKTSSAPSGMFASLLNASFPAVAGFPASRGSPAVLSFVSGVLPLPGIALAWALFAPRRRKELVVKGIGRLGAAVTENGLGFDRLYDALFVKPSAACSRQTEGISCSCMSRA
jgi:NADH-quinone oxidoreductase subunit L